MSQELELKYLIEDAAAAEAGLDALFPPTAEHPWRTHAIADHYFDTPDAALARAAYGARLRIIDRRPLLTLKTDLEVAGGRHRRLELEAPAGRSLRDPRRWRRSEARDRLLELTGGKRLVESFVVSQRRREREIHVGRARLMLSVDDATVSVAGRQVGELRQLEVELLTRSEAALAKVAQRLAEAGLGQPAPNSKLAMAAGIVTAAQPLRGEDDFAEAGRRVLRSYLLRMLEREIALRDGDPEALRQMRVATRRMRTAWRIFGAAFRKREERRWIAELRRVAGTLGAVRDLDVLLATLPLDAALAPLAEDWRSERDAARAALDTLLDSAEYAAFVDDYLELTGTFGAGVARRRPRTTVGDAVAEQVGAAEERVARAAEAATADSDDDAWHRLRIATKRLRYTLETFRDVLGPDTGSRIEELRARQTALGEMNDAAVAARAATAWLAEHGSTAAAATRTAIQDFVSAQRTVVAARRRALG